jgi:hypothetical protein
MDEILERFIKDAPVAVLVRGALCRVLAHTTLNNLFERVAQAQYTKELTFSTLVKLLVKVPFGSHDSVHSAYRHTADVPVSITAVYDKLAGIETSVSKALVEETAQSMREILEALPLKQEDTIAGLRLRTLDGNFLAGTEHRLECLRDSGAAALPGFEESQTSTVVSQLPDARREPSGENFTWEIRACGGIVTLTSAPSAIFFSVIE